MADLSSFGGARAVIDFNTLGLKLPIGVSFSLAKYWNGEPVVFECRRRSNKKAFFYVTFTIAEEADTVADDNAEEEGKKQDATEDVD